MAVRVPEKVVRPPQFWQTISFSPAICGSSTVPMAARISPMVVAKSCSVGAASCDVSMSAANPQLGQASFCRVMSNTSCAPHWPQPDEGVGDHRVIVDGDPQLTITTRADLPGGTRADGGNTTAANRLLGALNWLAEQKPGIYDGLQVPLRSVLPPEAEVTRWA